MKNVNKLSYLLLALVALLSSCGQKSADLEYIPFRSISDGRWGMISTDGKVLFDDEFNDMPQAVYCGRFFVKNKDGKYELYTADEKPQQVAGKTWADVSDFSKGLALAAEEGKPISIINCDGEQVADLSKIDGKSITAAKGLYEGHAIVETEDGTKGIVDDGGKTIVGPGKYKELEYVGEGKCLALDKKYENAEKDQMVIQIISIEGKTLGEINTSKINFEGARTTEAVIFNNGLLGAYDANGRGGLINEKGEWVLEPSEKVKHIIAINGDKFIYSGEDGMGIMDKKGEVLIRGKYFMLQWAGDDLLWAFDTKGENKDMISLINLKDEIVGKESFKNGYTLQDGTRIAQLGKHDYGFIDEKGEVMKLDKNVNIADIGIPRCDQWVESQYVDVQRIVSSLELDGQKMYGITIWTPADKAIPAFAEKGQKDATCSVKPSDSPYSYFQSRAEYECRLSNTVRVKKYLTFNNYITRYSNGQQFNPESLVYMIGADVKVSSGAKAVYESICKLLKSKGLKEIGKSEESITYDLGNQIQLYVSFSGEEEISVQLIPDESCDTGEEYD
ncbi:MAG: WG repeat-containing protein [Prevotella sp.]|nr:WG repeat-containing protein [Prevotella sp.]MDY5665773.1 WG repeat-containing protein [Alloprevotella sp.]